MASYRLGPVNTTDHAYAILCIWKSPSSVSSYRAMLTDTTRQCDIRQSVRPEPNFVRRRTGGKWPALPKRFGNWHTILYAQESVVEERGARSRLCPAATGTDHPDQDRSRGLGQDPRQGSSRWDRGVNTNGSQAIGRSCGRWTTTIHLVTADARTVLTFVLSPGQAHDAPEGRKLLHRIGSMLAQSLC
jgi:hypothetical protein